MKICSWSDAYDGNGVLCFNNTNNITINRNPSSSGMAILKFNNCMKYGAFDIPANPDNRFIGDCGRMITCTLTAGSTTVSYTGPPIDPSYSYDVWDPDPTRINAGTTYIIGGSPVTNITSTSFTISSPPSNMTGTVNCNLGIISNCRIVGLDYSKLAGCGNMIHFNFCKNISINNLELDGNIDNAIIGGGGAADGLQVAYDAIFINASNDITINNINEHHFGHDGLWLRYVDCDFPVTASTNDMNCFILNSKFQFNGRNALSWTGGSLLRCYNSEFSFSGQSRIASSPAAGMDIEFEPRGYYAQGTSYGTFVNCRFRYNRQHGFISDCELNERFDVHTFLFDGCDFVSGESTDCVWPRAAGCHFLNSNFYGLMQCPFSNSTLLTNFDAQNDCIFENCFFAENYKDRDPLAPIECFGIHSFSSTEPETIYSGGVWIEGTNCPVHKPQIDFSNATRVMFLGGLSEQQFSNRCMILGTSLSSNPPPVDDWNWVNGTIFASNGMNYCGCERLQVSINYTKIGLGNLYFRWVTPWRITSAPPCNPYQAPFSYLEPFTLTAANDPVLYGESYTGHYNDITNPVFVLEDLVPKFLNINDTHSEMPLLQSPCLSTPAFKPLSCLPPARIKNFEYSDQIGNLTVTPVVSINSITVESYPTNVNCQILNSLGEIVINNISISHSKEIDISNLRAGFYIIKSSFGSTAKFIKN